MTETTGAMQVDAALVRQLAELLDETRLTEIEVQDGDRRIRVARNVSVAAPAATQAAPASVPGGVEPATAVDNPNMVRSPMVGTAYLSAEPGSRPFAAVGDQVAEGATLLIIEAMKVMNAVQSPRAGKVMRVLVDNGQPVEFDQPLVVVE